MCSSDLAMEVNPYRGEAGPARLVYADIRTALEEFGINWVPARIVWDGFNPHPDLAELPRESVFVSPGNGNPQAINRRNVATASLQEILLLYPGYFQPRQQPNLTFEPLLQTGKVSGVSSFFDLVQPSPSGFTINPNPSRTPDGRTYVMAASVRSDKPIVEDPGAHPLNLVDRKSTRLNSSH